MQEVLTIKNLRERYGLTRQEFCKMFRIPYRTLQSWELGERECPEWVFSLIAYRFKSQKGGAENE